jgi:hypothetical protein
MLTVPEPSSGSHRVNPEMRQWFLELRRREKPRRSAFFACVPRQHRGCAAMSRAAPGRCIFVGRASGALRGELLTGTDAEGTFPAILKEAAGPIEPAGTVYGPPFARAHQVADVRRTPCLPFR